MKKRTTTSDGRGLLVLLPKWTPPLEVMLADIGSPSSRELAKALKVHHSTVERWKRIGKAPRTALLALFYITRWGRSDVHCRAENDARAQAALAFHLKSELDKATAQLARLGQIGDFGSANDPATGAPAGSPQSHPVADVGQPLETAVQPQETARLTRAN